MKKKLLVAAGVLAALVAGLLAVAAFQPSEFRIVRTGGIDVPPARVFDHVNVLKNWQAWSPWARKDPAATSRFEGPEGGKGAVFHWAGNEQVGEGTMTVLESEPASRIRLRLEFRKPMQDVAEVEFRFEPAGTGTKVTWTMSGTNGLMEKLFCMFMDLDAIVGGDFEQGLASLKAVAEAKERK